MSGTEPKVATIEDLRRLIARAQASPAERDRLLNSTEQVLQAEGLIASPSAVAFLQSLGTADYAPPEPKTPDPNGEGTGEMSG